MGYFLSDLQSQLPLLNKGQDYAQSFQVLPSDGIGGEEVNDEFPLDEIQLEALLGRVVLLAVLVALLRLLVRQNLGETILCFPAEALEVLIQLFHLLLQNLFHLQKLNHERVCISSTFRQWNILSLLCLGILLRDVLLLGV